MRNPLLRQQIIQKIGEFTAKACLKVRFLLACAFWHKRYRFSFNLNNSFTIHAAQLARDGTPVGRYELREFFARKRQRERIAVQRVLREMQIK